MGWVTLHELLVAGEVNYITGRPKSLWSNVLVLPNFEVGDRIRSDAEGKISISSTPCRCAAGHLTEPFWSPLI